MQKLEGDGQSKQRLEVILRTLSGQLSSEQACEMLGIGPTQLARLRERALAGALAALEPKPPGRPPAQHDPEPSRVAELEQEVQDLKIDLRAAQIREEIAIVMPHLLRPEAKKKRPPRRRRRRRKK